MQLSSVSTTELPNPDSAVPSAALPRRGLGPRSAIRLAIGYTAFLALALCGMRFVGESWWVTTAALYLPRVVFAAPLAIIVAMLLLAGVRRRLWLLAVPVALLLFPLMGLHVGGGVLEHSAHAGGSGLRVLSYNISSGDHPAEVAATIAAAKADLVLMQEWDLHEAAALATLTGYETHFDGQFGVLSRYPISEVEVPPRVPIAGGGSRPAEFIRYVVATDVGPVTVFNVHPISPRDSFVRLTPGRQYLERRPGRLAREDGITSLRRNALARWSQAQAIAAAARKASGAVIIAGDTNLPELSRIYGETLADYRDGFAEAGRGFGYTFPASHPWMRIDRILANTALQFQRFDVLDGPGSDHRAIAANLTAN
jgi:vancomycin resistance protein VanJ